MPRRRTAATAQTRPTKRKKIVALAQHEAETVAPTAGDVAPSGDNTAPPAVETTDKTKRTSGLDAAASVLAEADEPLSAGEMIKQMLEKGLWKTGGKTPANTLYAAILREINVKGTSARFRKTARGKFELAK